MSLEDMPEKDTQQYPDLEQFEGMSVDDKVTLFTSLPVNAQKLLIGTSAFASTVRPDMAHAVSQLTPEEFEEARELLSKTPFFSQTETGRLDVAQPMRDFINTDLKRIWEEQQQVEQERTKTPTQEDYQREYEYHVALQQHNQAFDELLLSIPKKDTEVREALRGLWNPNPDKLLNPEELVKLKTENEDLFKRVSTAYSNYLKKIIDFSS